MTIFGDFSVRTIINAKGTATRPPGSNLRPEVAAAITACIAGLDPQGGLGRSALAPRGLRAPLSRRQTSPFRRCYGREFCGRPDQHPYELFLQLEDIEHHTTRVKRPQSNGIVERFHRTLLDEHFRVGGQRIWFETIDEMQASPDDYLVTYNTRRPHQGRGMNGKTPLTVFKAGLPKPTPQKKEKSPPQKTENQLAA